MATNKHPDGLKELNKKLREVRSLMKRAATPGAYRVLEKQMIAIVGEKNKVKRGGNQKPKRSVKKLKPSSSLPKASR